MPGQFNLNADLDAEELAAVVACFADLGLQDRLVVATAGPAGVGAAASTDPWVHNNPYGGARGGRGRGRGSAAAGPASGAAVSAPAVAELRAYARTLHTALGPAVTAEVGAQSVTCRGCGAVNPDHSGGNCPVRAASRGRAQPVPAVARPARRARTPEAASRCVAQRREVRERCRRPWRRDDWPYCDSHTGWLNRGGQDWPGARAGLAGPAP